MHPPLMKRASSSHGVSRTAVGDAVRRCAPLLGVCLLVVGGGCSASYNGERLFWHAQQLQRTIVKDPQHLSAPALEKAIAAFRQVIEQAPGTVWAPRAALAIGGLQAVQKHYDQAREVYTSVLQNYTQYPPLCLKARMALALIAQAEGKWEAAVKAYEELADYHPWDPPGLEAPLAIGMGYEKRGQHAQAVEAYEHAKHRYTKLIHEAPTPQFAMEAKAYLGLTHQQLEQWDEAVSIFEELVQTPATKLNRPLLLLSLGAIYQEKLHNPQRAQEVYMVLAEEFPQHAFGRVAKARLEQLGAPLPHPPSPPPPAVR